MEDVPGSGAMAGVLRGDIRRAELDPVRGHEQAGWRPVLVLSRNAFNRGSSTVIALPLTSRPPDAGFPLTLELSTESLRRQSWVKISQIRTLAVERLGRRIGRASSVETSLAIRGLNELLTPGCRRVKHELDVAAAAPLDFRGRRIEAARHTRRNRRPRARPELGPRRALSQRKERAMAVFIVYPIAGAHYPIVGPPAAGVASAYFQSSFAVSCGGGPHKVEWGFDALPTIGSGTFYDEMTVQLTHKLPGGPHLFWVRTDDNCGKAEVKFHIG